MFEKSKDYQYFLNNIPLKKEVWDRTKLWEISDKEGRYFFHLLYDKLKTNFSILDKIDPVFFVAYSTINDIYRFIIKTYLEDNLKGYCEKIIIKPLFDISAKRFIHSYPPKEYRIGFDFNSFLNKNYTPMLKKSILFEMIILKISEENPALSELKEIIIDKNLFKNKDFLYLIELLEKEIQSLPPTGPLGLNLFELLREPIRSSPNSLYGQIKYIREKWQFFLPSFIIEELEITLDIVKEYQIKRFGGPGPSEIISFKKTEVNFEPERFTPDIHWMPEVVLIAKLVYVWLYQLSKKYSKEIKRLDQIPDEELDILKDWGFNALWLIGIWERSPASRKIKHLMGNPDAHASAYSLYDYIIAEELGGEEAFENFKRKAIKRGIRLASDMVPNHVGIYSKWIIEHPDWFIQLDYPPFPKYSFTKHNLSLSSDIEIYIEDGYYDKTDASVVFKYVDRRDGKIRYIYHGNDGTSTPWNDTAQLNYLLPEVREAVIQTIPHVAKRTPIIRFDAAMTLTKRHYQRLWFPIGGQGGAIPSRAEQAMSKEEFDRLMPEEFWREVVDRVSKEAPDTLLLAEAFWLLEGYFVRSLGMHRVYNSAFMNMLKNEENAKYRQMVKNILHFNPEILKRFVNFMSNPDEQTAIEQFGDGGKYLGVCVLLVTMPGLPMFAHGQVEGFKEKYGMEFHRAYWDEIPNSNLIELHKRFIFPLMKKRYLFSESENFYFYDFITTNGVDEDVFAYSNYSSGERTVVIYNNRYKTTKGFIKISCEKMVKLPDGSQKHLISSIGEALKLKKDGRVYYLFKNHRDNLFCLKSGIDIFGEGLYFELGAYEFNVFTDIREIFEDEEGTLSKIYGQFKNRYFSDFNQLYLETKYKEIIERLSQALYLNIENIDKFFDITIEIFKEIKKESILEGKEKIESISELLDKDRNYRLINLLLLNEFLKKSGKNLFEFLQNIGAINFLERTDSLNKLCFSILLYLYENPIEKDFKSFIAELFRDDRITAFLMVNRFKELNYFNKERFEELLVAYYLTETEEIFSKEELLDLIKEAKNSNYSLEKLLEAINPEGRKEEES